MGMGNLQRMAMQMQQEMERIQAELAETEVEGSAGGGVVRAVVTGKQSLVSVDDRPVRRRPRRRRDAPGPGDRRDQRGARRIAPAGRAEDGRDAVAGRARRPPRSLTDPTRVATLLIEPVAKLIEAFNRLPGIGPEDGPAADLPPPACPRRWRRGPSHPRSSRSARRSCSASAASTSATRRSARSAATRAATRHGICVVEEPLDVLAIERTAEFRGVYHVLHGAISPIDGVGPDRLKIRELLDRVDEAAAARRPFVEVILATNPTLEGEATAMYLDERLAGKVGSVTRIARGHPGRRRPRVRRRGDADPRAPGSARDRRAAA